MPETPEHRLPLVTERQLDLLLKRVAEIQALFVLVERITPFVQDLVSFVFDVGPLLVRASRTLAESSAKMPRATQHLEDVTQATEMATAQVLDRVDDILQNLDEIRNGVTALGRVRRRLRAIQKDLEQLAAAGEKADVDREALRRVAERVALTRRLMPSRTRLLRLVDSTQEYGYEIMSALQVQDITAQQLAAARELINRVHTRVMELLRQLGEDGEVEEPVETGGGGAFDADAKFDFQRSALRQEHVDRLLESLLGSAVEQSVRGDREEA